MAGGVGTRLWPKSREKTPKQFQKIIGNETLLKTTFKRVKPLVKSLDHIFVSTNEQYAKLARKELPELPAKNLIVEPVARNTAPAMAVAAYLISKRDPEAIVATAPSDHVVLNKENYYRAIRTGVAVLHENPHQLLTVGIKPTYPETGYGYIRIGRPYSPTRAQKLKSSKTQIFHVAKFVEKPDEKTAHRYVDSGRYLWNASYFMWQAKHFLGVVKHYLPAIHRRLPEYPKYFSQFPNVAIDTAIAEKVDDILVIPADLGWSDIGSWAAVFDIIKTGDHGNVVAGKFIGIDTKNSLIQGADRLIATVGVENMVVVDTGDVILIAEKGASQKVKEVIEKLRKQGKTKYL